MNNKIPSFVKEIVEGYLYKNKFYKESFHETEIPGEIDKLYVDLNTQKTYGWCSNDSSFINVLVPCFNWERLKVGDIVKHFKRETLDHPDNLYVYKILNFATHTETKEKLVIYQAMYSNEEMGVSYDVYARPYSMFMSEVDRDKYPYIKQKYRFEKL